MDHCLTLVDEMGVLAKKTCLTQQESVCPCEVSVNFEPITHLPTQL